ncbi:MAG: hypothetical protein ABI794_00960 [Betaproteobacteria bacterium]
MQALVLRITACVFALFASAAHAEFATIEEAASVTADNVTRFESDSPSVQSGRVRFDVTVAWKDGVVRPQGAPPRKIIRYLAKCADKMLALSSVAVYGISGETEKMYGIAPGGWDFAVPEDDSLEAQWLKKACAAAS